MGVWENTRLQLLVLLLVLASVRIGARHCRCESTYQRGSMRRPH